MKTKTIKALVLFAILIGCASASVKIIKSNYEVARLDFLSHAKGQAQNFINAFID